ncbi:hypothetical protein JCM10212_003494 [Sporobolomyces blumeae]
MHAARRLLSTTCSRQTRTMTVPGFPSYLVHAPFLSVVPPDPATVTPPYPLLQRQLPPSPLYYLTTPPATKPNAPPPSLSLLPTVPLQGRVSKLYRATSESGTRVVLKYSTDFLALIKEADEVYVNLPHGSLPIPTFYGTFIGSVEKDQTPGVVTVLSDCGEPLPERTGFDSLTRPEKQKLYDTLTVLHDIHFQHGSFSPGSIVSEPVLPSSCASSDPASTTPSTHSSTSSSTTTTTTTTTTRATSTTEAATRGEQGRKLTLVGFSQAEWHLCPGQDKCPELVKAKADLGL